MPRIPNRPLTALTAGVLTVVALTCLPASTRYHIREAYSFRAGGNGAGIRLAVMIPTTGPYQQVRNVVTSWDGTKARESEGAVEVVKLTGQIEAGQEKIATIAYDVVLRRGQARWDAPVEEFQLQPQPGLNLMRRLSRWWHRRSLQGRTARMSTKSTSSPLACFRGAAKAALMRTCFSSRLSMLTKAVEGYVGILQT